jgi:uncharacterized protein YyaL (SSP411 family)
VPRHPSRRAALEKDDDDAKKVRLALAGMRGGGIWDHLGGGFHRYSTDERWLVPHFEKMLYDNALLLRLYTMRFAPSTTMGSPRPPATSEYLLRGYKARPAASTLRKTPTRRREGKFFVWTENEVKDALCDDPLAAKSRSVTSA